METRSEGNPILGVGVGSRGISTHDPWKDTLSAQPSAILKRLLHIARLKVGIVLKDVRDRHAVRHQVQKQRHRDAHPSNASLTYLYGNWLSQ